MKRTCLTFNKENNDEFADDDWNEEDFAKIDQCVAMSQCKVTKNLLGDDEFDALNEDLAAIDIPPSNPNRFVSSTMDDAFGDDDDDELAAIDLTAPMTQPNATVLKSFLFEDNFGGVTNASTSSKVVSANSGEFSDDDFADIDFIAIDNKVAQHQMEQAMKPSKHTRNWCNHNANNTLCFTRHAIKSVDEKIVTNTKTLGVLVWSLDEARSKNTDELECLRKYQEDAFASNFNATALVHGYIHLRGIWYYTKCHRGDGIHLISISGQYATDTITLPVVSDSLHSWEC